MQQNSAAETLLSAMVLAVAGGFTVYVAVQTGTGSLSSYELTAKMAHADGIKAGDDVKIAGMTVGKILDLTLEPKNYLATVRMNIRADLKIPKDSSLSVTDGTMSSSYLLISPGYSKDTIQPGGTLLRSR